MSDSIDWRIIDRHLAGDASSADAEALRQWLAADPRHALLLDQLRSVSAPDRSLAGESWNVDSAWSRLTGRLADERPASHLVLERTPASRQSRRVSWRLAAAATTALVAAGVVALLWSAPRASSGIASAPSSPVREVASARAQQTRVTLRDGTRVVLNAGSRLRYSADFDRLSRDVELEGEGYFDVVHDASRPFRVRMRGGVAEDLGTRFAVRAYADGAPPQVVVAQGSVSLARDDAGMAKGKLLRPGQLGRIEPDGRISVVSDVDVDRWMSWTAGALVLDGLSLAEAATEIGRRYDVRVVVPDAALARRRVSARFHDAPLPRVLDALAVALGARWSNDGVAIVILRAE
ncbi:MAG: FecR domain-containing protein [bacterium]